MAKRGEGSKSKSNYMRNVLVVVGVVCAATVAGMIIYLLASPHLQPADQFAFISAMVAVIAGEISIAAMIVGYHASEIQDRTSEEVARAQDRVTFLGATTSLVLQLYQQYTDSSRLSQKRQSVAQTMIKGWNLSADEMCPQLTAFEDIANFFETIGIMAKEGAIKVNLVYNFFSEAAIDYYQLGQGRFNYIENMRANNNNDKTIWANYEELVYCLKAYDEKLRTGKELARDAIKEKLLPPELMTRPIDFAQLRDTPQVYRGKYPNLTALVRFLAVEEPPQNPT